MVGGVNLDHIFSARFDALGVRYFQGTRQIINHGVNQNLDPFFLESGATEHRNHFDLAGQPADGCLQNQRLNRFVCQNQIGDDFVLVGDSVDQLGQGCFGLCLEILRDLDDVIFQTFIDHFHRPPSNSLLIDNIDYALEIVFRPDGKENRKRVSIQLLTHVIQCIVKVGTRPVHLVDEGDPRDFILGCLPPNRLGLRLHTRDTAENSYCPVEHPH